MLLGAVSPTLRAEDQATDKKPGAERREALKKRAEEFKNLTPEERAAKRKEMREKREKLMAELKAKKTAGTITEKEQKQLDRLEAMGKHEGQPPGKGPRCPKKPEDKPSGDAKPN